MDFIEVEKLLARKRLTFSQLILLCFFAIISFFLFITDLIDGNYLSIFLLLICIFLSYGFWKEIAKLADKNQILTFQRNIVTSAFDSSIFASFIFSDTGKCVFVNRVAQNLFPGFRIRTIEDFTICFGKFPKVVNAIHELRNFSHAMKQSHIDVPINLDGSGTSLWRVAVSPVSNQKGFSAWSVIDLTPSLNRLESPETNVQFLLELINKSNVGYFCLDENDDFVFCNNTFSEWVGEPIENILNTNCYTFISKNESDDFLKDNDSIGLVESMPMKIVLKSLKNEAFKVVVKPLFKNAMNIRGFLISEEAEQSGELLQTLEKTKLYFEHIFEEAPVGILITDGAEIISACNGTMKSIFGKEKVTGLPLLTLIEDEKKELIREKLYNMLKDIHPSMERFEIQVQSKKTKNIMVYVSKIEESKRTKENDGLIFYFIDITERKELQMQFVQSQKMQAVGQLAGGIAHDFNNLLTAMIGYCDLLLEKYVPSDQAFNDVMQIKQNANRASNLVRQLLAFSRQQTLQPKILSVTDMINELSSLLKRLLGAKIELKVSHSRDVGFIKVDQIQFEQVIINLAVNARDAMKDGGTLSIITSEYSSEEPKLLRGSTVPPGNYVLIEVKDSGSGMPERILSRIFDPFFSTKEKGRGTGLGLSTVYGIVDQTGGFISVDSEVDIGTTFSIYFPRISPTEYDVSNKVNTYDENKIADLSGTGTILLVEDEDAVRMFSSRALRDKGYDVIEAQNGEAAFEIIKNPQNKIDLIITDVVMPKMDGPTLMENIKNHNPLMKIIFISGYTEDNFRESLKNDSKVHFISKPFDLKQLTQKVKEVMEKF